MSKNERMKVTTAYTDALTLGFPAATRVTSYRVGDEQGECRILWTADYRRLLKKVRELEADNASLAYKVASLSAAMKRHGHKFEFISPMVIDQDRISKILGSKMVPAGNIQFGPTGAAVIANIAKPTEPKPVCKSCLGTGRDRVPYGERCDDCGGTGKPAKKGRRK